ncbi:MAG: zf-HC2 domain-containing protein [Vicinamibacteria bacterium]|jgi:hypothetical protein|nr:zf-HC2 domain-containing protein [Vicinamibacteria bacterium]MBP9945869.1 zf-HC2 domain-containing protein [Vicinamibacteria bacterium]
MTFLHFRFKDRLGLLADGSLAPAEAAAVRAHLGSCVSCQAEFEGLTRLTAALREEAAFDRPLPISSDALRTRVFARIHAEAHPLPASRSWGFVSGLAAAGLVGLGVLTGVFMARDGATRVPAVVADAAPQEDRADIAVTANNTAFYERLEKTQLRADAVRYLAEAQDILVQMRAAADCPDSPQDSVDVAHESKNSRTLLRRRAALVSGSGETLVAARGVMEEVEGLLQQVAELPRCTRRAEVAAIARNVEQRNLLMKIDMVAQELAAP